MDLGDLLAATLRGATHLDEGAQHDLLTVAQARRRHADLLARRDDAAPGVLTRILDATPSTSDPAVRAAATHPNCPLDAIERLVDRAGTVPSYLANRDTLPGHVAGRLVAAARTEGAIVAAATRPWVDAAGARTLTRRLLDLPDHRELEPGDDVSAGALDALRTLMAAHPRSLAAVAVERATAGAWPGTTAMLVSRAVGATLDPAERVLLADHLILDELRRTAAGRRPLADEIHHRLYHLHDWLLSDDDRAEVGRLLDHVDLSGCGRRQWLIATFGRRHTVDDWLADVTDQVDVMTLVASRRDVLPDDVTVALLGRDDCDTTTALSLLDARGGGHDRPRRLLEARPHDREFVAALLARHPELLTHAARLTGADAVELVVAAAGQLDGTTGFGAHERRDRAHRLWAPILAADVDRVPAGLLPSLVGHDPALDDAVTARLARLGRDTLAAETAVRLAGDWDGTLGELTDAVGALRPVGTVRPQRTRTASTGPAA